MKVTVHTKQKKHNLGDLYGIFFEDLNHAADGGLYGELVENRAFEFDSVDNGSYTHLTGWEVLGTDEEIHAKVLTGNPVNEKNPHYLVMDIHKAGEERGISNAGFHGGMPFRQDETYVFSCWAKREQDLDESLCISLRDEDGKVLAWKEILLTTQWQKYELTLTPSRDAGEGKLAVTAHGRGKVYLDFVSLFPEDTYRGRKVSRSEREDEQAGESAREKGVLRRDLAELLENMHPKFLRFPGGCLTHDGALDPDARDAQYRWKNTVGPIEGRPARRNNWGYNQTLGLGFYELFQFCEDIGAKPLPVISPGYDPHHHREAPLNHMQYFIDEALDLIEFANGSADSKWGSLRAEMGHPEPFGLEYLAIGNEEVGEAFFERYKIVAAAVRERYPEIKLIGTSGPNAAGGEYERGWRHAKEGLTDLVDEHYYQFPEWFVANHDRYATFKEDDPGVFLGEYASQGNTWYNALCEASFMIGLEENAGAVKLACYAPLLCSANHVNWRPDLIWFDGARSFGTANYYVQKLFMENQGCHTLVLEKDEFPTPECRTEHPDRIRGWIELGNYDSTVEYRDIVLRDEDSGESFSFAPCSLTRDGKPIALKCMEGINYTLTLRATEVEGYKGFRIHFGVEDDRNRLFWTVGGWQNQDTVITERLKGKNADLSQCLKTVEQGREYELKLQVAGRRIRTYIDGKLYHDIDSRPVMVEPVYLSAVEDENGDILVKAVNLSGEDRETEISLQGLEGSRHCLKASVMNGWRPEEENSFEEPEKISPKEEWKEFTGAGFNWNFPAESITVLRIER